MNQRTFSKTFVLIIAAILCWDPRTGGTPNTDSKISLKKQFERIQYPPSGSRDYDGAIKKLEAFANEHPKHDLAAEAHLHIASLMERKKRDLKGAIAKVEWLVKWTAKTCPKARKQPIALMGDIPRTMGEEWAEYVEEHPILMKDFAWYQLAELYKESKRYDDALAAYNHVLSTVKPDKLPDTKNQLIFITFRLHKAAFEQKIALLKKMKKKEEAKKAAEDYEKLYPKAAWHKLGLEVSAAHKSYIEESKRLRELEAQEERKRREEERKRYQEEVEREEAKRKQREEELKKQREEERKEREARQRAGRGRR